MIALLASIALSMTPIQASSKHPILTIWPAGAPNGWHRSDQETSEKNEKENFLIVANVSVPTLEVFRASHPKPHSPTVIVCPGGGYSIEAIEHEGWEIAERLNRAGFNAAVLKYRLPNRETDHPLAIAPLQDAQRALRVLRFHAAEYGVDPSKIGIMGFSAGGHLSAIASNQASPAYQPLDAADALSFLPNFTILIYPAYLENEEKGRLADDVVVGKETPPVFIAQTMDDPVHVEGAFEYALACKAAGVPAEIHVWAKGGHGYGLRTKEPGLRTWPDLLIQWLAQF